MSRYAILSPTRWHRPLALILLMLAGEAQLVALAGNDAPATGGATVNASFQCSAEASGTRDFPAPGGAGTALHVPCFFRLYATRCDAPTTSGDVARQQCRTESLAEFALQPGETRFVNKLPAGYRYCVGLKSAPTLEECTRNPAPH